MTEIERPILEIPDEIADKRTCRCGRIVGKDELHGDGCLFCQGEY